MRTKCMTESWGFIPSGENEAINSWKTSNRKCQKEGKSCEIDFIVNAARFRAT